MADVVSPAVRSRMMAGIRGKDTKPEIMLRRGLHRLGFRFQLHRKDLPGKPDMVFPKHRAVIFAHGCFWHGHGCHLFKWPKTRADFWERKIAENRLRDVTALEGLRADGWRVAEVWECALKGKTRLPAAEVLDLCGKWLRSDADMLQIRGDETRKTV